MNILFITPYIPNLVRVRPYNLLRHLARLDHRVTLLALYAHETERHDAFALEPYCERIELFQVSRSRSFANSLGALPRQLPLQAAYSWQPYLARRIFDLLSNSHPFDAVHVEHLRGSGYALHAQNILDSLGHPTPVVWDSVDCISLLFEKASQNSQSLPGRVLTRLDLGRTRRYEGWLATRFQQILVTSPVDRQALLGLAPASLPASTITVLPNGVDLDYFAPNPDLPRQDNRLVLSGKMSYHANVTMTLNFVQNILPLIWQARPDVTLTIAGKDPPREIQALAADPRLTVTGAVADLRPYLQSAAVAVSPVIYGVGIQNKVLEALACATPVVSSSPAISALTLEPGKDVLVADQPQDFAVAVLRLLGDTALRATHGQRGREYVERCHRWESIAHTLAEIYRQG